MLKIKGFWNSKEKEIVSIQINENEYYKIIDKVEHLKLSDELLSFDDDQKDIYIILMDDNVLREIHKKVNDIDELIEYIVLYAQLEA